jgi:hypothetical protein
MSSQKSVGKTRAAGATRSRKAGKAGSRAAPKAGTRAAPKAGAKGKSSTLERGSKPAPREAQTELLTGGNPRIAKGDGDGPVQAYIAALPGWKRDLGRRLDALIVKNVPTVSKAVKWNSPFYGIAGRGWFLGIHSFTHYVKIAFFRGSSLRPPPPGASKSKDTRYLDIRETDEIDDAQIARWVKQAAALPGWIP